MKSIIILLALVMLTGCLLALGPENWQEYQLLRIARYQRRSKRIYVNGHINRVIKLTEAIWNIIKERRGVK